MRLNGADFVAVTTLYAPWEGLLVVVANVGQTCEYLPNWDLERLAARGKIRRVEKPAKKEGKANV